MDPAPQKPRFTITEHNIGVWKLKFANKTIENPTEYWKKLKATGPVVRRLVVDVFSIAPALFTMYLMLQVLHIADITVNALLSNRLLRAVETGLLSGKHDEKKIITSILFNTFRTAVMSFFYQHQASVSEALETRVVRHFDTLAMEAEFRKPPSAIKVTSEREATPGSKAWYSLVRIVQSFQELFGTVSQILLIWHISRTSGGGLFFALLCAGNVLYEIVRQRFALGNEYLARDNNIDYRRSRMLQRFIHNHKLEIASNGAGPWAIKELKDCYDRLRDISLAPPHIIISKLQQRSTMSNAILNTLEHLPTAYCALSGKGTGSSADETASLASVATLQRLAGEVKDSLSMLGYYFHAFIRSVQTIEVIYASIEEVNDEGKAPYPPTFAAVSSCGYNPASGMSLELRNVVFSYPSDKKLTPALNGVSIKISAGQLVVVVGENGCGKSTLIRILSRMEQPTSGEFLIDGKPAAEYRSDELQRATVLLTQHSELYPFSLAENIGLGNLENIDDEEMILEAARKGGAVKIIENCKDGLQTLLSPGVHVWASDIYHLPADHPLQKEYAEVPREVELSGGETQRMAAARAFFRFNSGKVRFVAVDEPSSALDAEAELELFNNLRAEREGKTMVMVTHRFGHLTKFADMIICMKDGVIVEHGKHQELMKQGGHYANLYSIQAQAFTD
ncbi:P-loop containing nucleoside triphosphate hydrolase protein [Agrocybe pediades]|nr:P-loop containing nucleoside triphosphate hydrolase protein [Agrocybe pediades]